MERRRRQLLEDERRKKVVPSLHRVRRVVYARAVEDYNPNRDVLLKQVKICRNDIILVRATSWFGWSEGINLNSQETGWFPDNHSLDIVYDAIDDSDEEFYASLPENVRPPPPPRSWTRLLCDGILSVTRAII